VFADLFVDAATMSQTTALPLGNCTPGGDELCCEECAAQPIELWSGPWFVAAVSALLCVIGAALAAGLTMGMTAQDLTTLRIKKSINPDDYEDEEERQRVAKEKRWAGKVEPLVRRHHLLLVSLLLMNAGVNEALPIFLGQIVPEWVAVVLSVSFVLFFGEIIPSAILTGPNSLCISAGLSWFVWCIIVVLFPLSWPIGKVLDLCLGEEHGMRSKFDPIETRVRLDLEAADHAEAQRHEAHAAAAAGRSANYMVHSSLLDYHKIMRGAVNLATATAADINTKHRSISKIACLSMDTVLDADQLAQMLRQGFSRYPVYEGDSVRNIRGVLLTKNLILQNPERHRTVSDLKSLLVAPLLVGPKTKLPDLLNQFQSGRCHMALVTTRQSDVELVQEAWRLGTPLPATALSHIITMEDLIEMILKETILDETDNRIIQAISHVKGLVRKQKFMSRLRQKIIRKVSVSGQFGAADAPKHSAKASTEGVVVEAQQPLLDTRDYSDVSGEISSVFAQVDQDGDGKVGLADLRSAILYLLPNTSGGRSSTNNQMEGPSPRTANDVLALAEELMHDWDADGDERLTIGEFQTAIESLMSQDYSQTVLLDEQLDELFKTIDVDQNGLITTLELHAVVTHTLVRSQLLCIVTKFASDYHCVPFAL